MELIYISNHTVWRGFFCLFVLNKTDGTILKNKILSSIHDMIYYKEKNGLLFNNTAVKFCYVVGINLVNFREIILKRYLNWTYVWQRLCGFV